MKTFFKIGLFGSVQNTSLKLPQEMLQGPSKSLLNVSTKPNVQIEFQKTELLLSSSTSANI
uniref:Uncharacterized protein n=2 Tax=Anguilla anguilla TaxID=7936 RepID=A0A0E9RR85_ANGAN